VEVVLIESREEKDLISLDRTAERASALLLAAVRFKVHKRIGSAAESAVANIIEPRAVPVVGAGFRDYINHSAPRASLFGPIGIRGDAKLLHHFVRELVGRAVQAARLGEESVVEVAAIDQEAVLEAAQPAE